MEFPQRRLASAASVREAFPNAKTAQPPLGGAAARSRTAGSAAAAIAGRIQATTCAGFRGLPMAGKEGVDKGDILLVGYWRQGNRPKEFRMSQFPPPIQPGPLGMYQAHRGTMILVLGILGLVLCVICGIVAWVMGNADLREMDAGRMDPAGRGMTQAGKICGMIACILNVAIIGLWVVIMIFALVAGAGAAASGAGGPVGP